MSDSSISGRPEDVDEFEPSAIAVVGMACQFPGAADLESYWDNLRHGVESIKRFDDTQLLAAGESPALLADPDYVRAQPVLDGFDRFDAGFWGFNAQDAAVTDPAHRLFLEVSHHALEHAGHSGLDEEGTVGVFASSGASQYWMQNLQTNPDLMASMGEFLVRHTGNDMNFLATRLSYELDLRGPSVNVQTACSSALVAIHYAVASLLSEECDVALAGASTILLPQGRGYLYRQGEIMSPDGHCRPFDARSAGTIFGSGAGVVVLRRLADAVADGDEIHAIIRGSAINNDGAQKVGFLAPGVEGQAAVITEALTIGGVDPADVTYIEAHGTGTLVGDPIEMEALKTAFSEVSAASGHTLVGSVKANIGHLGEAAGIAAFIKAVLAVKHAQIPPTPNFESPNPEMDIERSPFAISTTLTDWRPECGIRYCGITALGAGGTNAHVVIEQAPPQPEHSPHADEPLPLVLSAKSEVALTMAAQQLASFLTDHPQARLADAAFTLGLGRRAYRHRAAVVATDRAGVVAALDDLSHECAIVRTAPERPAPLVFMFPGGGAQYAGMGAQLYRAEAVYATAFDRCIQCLDASAAAQIRRLVLDAANLPAAEQQQATAELEQPSCSLVALFATEYALAMLLQHWGATPAALIGHSMGEYTAACLAGVMSVDSAMALIRKRGELFEQAPPGGMLSVTLAPDLARQHLQDGLDIAAVNAPELCVVSGEIAQIEALQRRLTDHGIDCTRIHINVAAHSSMLDGIVAEFRTFCATIPLQPPQLPLTSNLTGDWMTPEQAISPDYWADHLRNTVQFAANVETVRSLGDVVAVEVGPGRTLTSLARACGLAGSAVYNTMRHPSERAHDQQVALRTLGGLWASGAAIDWSPLLHSQTARRLALPGYPFQRQRYWVEPGQPPAPAETPLAMSKRTDIGEWFGLLGWTEAGFNPPAADTAGQWLVFADNAQAAQLLCDCLPAAATVVVVLRSMGAFHRSDATEYHLDAADASQFDALFSALAQEQMTPTQILYAWTDCTADAPETGPASLDLVALDAALATSFWGLFYLAKALCDIDTAITLNVLTRELWAFNACPGSPLQAPVLGAVQVLPREADHVRTRLIDLQGAALATLQPRVQRELASAVTQRTVLLTPTQRWTRGVVDSYEPEPPAGATDTWVRAGGTYLITGGLGGIGLTVAEHLAQQGAGTIGLLSRTGLPPRSQWGTSAAAASAATVRAVQRIESHGARVEILVADVCDQAALSRATVAQLGALQSVHGVIHAAGAMDDQLIMVKSAESARQVLDAKMRGAVVLDRMFADASLDFMLLFSSIASYLGLPGQIDYTAANAFLDSLAQHRARRCSGFTAVVNWNAWRDVGMAASSVASDRSLAASSASLPPAGRAAVHPAITSAAKGDASSYCYSGVLSATGHWFIREHQVRAGQLLMPGTGLVELAAQAFRAGQRLPDVAGAAIELTDLRFIEALSVPSGGSVTFHVAVAAASDGRNEISIYTDDAEAPNVTALGAWVDAAESPLDLPSLQARCQVPQATDGRYLLQHFMDFGPRWGCIDAVWVNQEQPEALLQLSLAPELIADLAAHPLHPALLDMATGAAQFLIPGFDAASQFFVPYSYDRLRVFANLEAEMVSHVQLRPDSQETFVRFDVRIAATDGTVLVAIDGFTMKQIDPGSAIVEHTDRPAPANFRTLELSDILRHAIVPSEGINALDRLMRSQERCQWIVSSVSTRDWQQALEQPAPPLPNSASAVTFVHEDEAIDPDGDPLIPVVEAALLRAEGVTAAVVRCFGAAGLARRCVAFVESAALPESQPHSRAALNAHLRGAGIALTLDGLQVLPALPLQADGAPDRKALTDPLAPGSSYRAPGNATEATLAELWSALLGNPKISVDDHFFELGGHSLLLTRLIAKVQKTFERKLPLEQAYETPTISAWARLLLEQADQPKVVSGIQRANRARFKVE